VSNAHAFESLLDPEQSLLDAIRIAEGTKAAASPLAILQSVDAELGRIGVAQATSFGTKELQLLNEILSTLEGLKSLAKKEK
jgi:hypothetical protein